jgi:hypothetical protein
VGAVVKFFHKHPDDEREESGSCFSDIPTLQSTGQHVDATSPHHDDSARWLALLKVAVILGNRNRARFALSRGERCPKFGYAVLKLFFK